MDTGLRSLAEIFSIVVACGIFVVAWNTRKIQENGYLLWIGVAFLFVAVIDALHTLAYRGMGVFHAGTNLVLGYRSSVTEHE